MGQFKSKLFSASAEQLDFGRSGGDLRDPELTEEGFDMWMTQVALVTQDIGRLSNYYADIMGFNPSGEAEIENRMTFDTSRINGSMLL